jgi:hypothetical protein
VDTWHAGDLERSGYRVRVEIVGGDPMACVAFIEEWPNFALIGSSVLDVLARLDPVDALHSDRSPCHIAPCITRRVGHARGRAHGGVRLSRDLVQPASTSLCARLPQLSPIEYERRYEENNRRLSV